MHDSNNRKQRIATETLLSNTFPHVILASMQGDVYMEVQQVFNSWVSQSVRIFPRLPFVEFEYTIGPIPIELVTYLNLFLSSCGLLHTIKIMQLTSYP